MKYFCKEVPTKSISSLQVPDTVLIANLILQLQKGCHSLSLTPLSSFRRQSTIENQSMRKKRRMKGSVKITVGNPYYLYRY